MADLQYVVSTTQNVTSSTTAATPLLRNSKRRGLILSNDSTSKLYVLVGATGTVSATNFTFVIAAGATIERSDIVVDPGAVQLVWASANGSAGVTELV